MDKREEMELPEELYEFYPGMSAQTHEAQVKAYATKLASQARSQAYEECAKIAENVPTPSEYSNSWHLGFRAGREEVAQAIRQHSQKGEI